MNMQNLLKQAQKMQKELAGAEDALKEKTYESELSGGIIKAAVSGEMKVTDITIDESLIEKENKEDLQDMIITVINNALDAAVQDKEETMKSLTGGIKMPGGF